MIINMSNCSIQDRGNVIIKQVSWNSANGQNWLVTGANGSGKSVFVSALAGCLEIIPGINGFYQNNATGSIALVSFEVAAALIAEERKRDDSDYIEGGVDKGRTPRQLIMETICEKDRIHYPSGKKLEKHPSVNICGISPILDRGLKYLSTGEIRRTLLCRALAAKPTILIIDDPYDGLDSLSREQLSSLLEKGIEKTNIMLVMDHFGPHPAAITHVIEMSNREIAFTGTISEYKQLLNRREERLVMTSENLIKGQNDAIETQLLEICKQTSNTIPDSVGTNNTTLVEMKGVTVEWSGRKVLDNVTWTLKRGEHWLIRGPNGSGKTTFLELITGDNPQVFRNDVWLFGKKRGSGETIWELKEKMGIVSYRLHTDYRALGDLSLETVLLSGLHDSIGLYQQCGEEERSLAEKWLALAGFSGRGTVLFRDLSYGEQRAVLIARAAIKQPPIMILDEPCHGLDETHRRTILALLQAIAEKGSSTFLHVTHDPTEVLPCERHILELNPEKSPMYRIVSL